MTGRDPVETGGPGRRSDLLALGAFVLLCLAVSGIGAAVTATSVGTWYQGLEKPAFSPPDWLFGPVWTALYLMMAVAAWRVWRAPVSVGRSRALAAFGAQLALNLAWPFLFFGFRSPGAALAEIAALVAAVAAATAVFWRVDRAAGALFVPYLLWAAYATALNAAIWLLN